MNRNNRKVKLEKKLPILLTFIFVAIIIISFLFSLIRLILDPVNIFVVENGEIYEEETTYRIYCKRRNCT